jgi:hypothetical protein
MEKCHLHPAYQLFMHPAAVLQAVMLLLNLACNQPDRSGQQLPQHLYEATVLTKVPCIPAPMDSLLLTDLALKSITCTAACSRSAGGQGFAVIQRCRASFADISAF